MVISEYNKTILPSGLTIVSEKIPTVRSVTVGAWIKSGSRHEKKDVNGLAHFLEHMMFKGTKKRSARQIARSLESAGGYLNAFTSKEQTCYYGEILDAQLPKAIDILSDMICHSTFSQKEMEKEREVILDEIDSIEDTPDDLVQDIFVEKLFPGNSLGYPILGNKKTVTNITQDKIINFYTDHYTTENTVIAAAGNLEHNRLVDLCQTKFQLRSNSNYDQATSPDVIGNGEFILNRSVNQVHLCLGTKGLPYAHHRKFELLLLNTVLGVGMGSRLFQNIRERHGVAYSVYSFVDFFRDNGLLGIYLGTDKSKISKAIKLLSKEIDRLKNKPLSKRELQQVKSQVKGNLMLGLESTARRMSRLAKSEIYLKTFYDIDRIIFEIDKITTDGIYGLVNDLFSEEHLLKVMFLPKKGE